MDVPQIGIPTTQNDWLIRKIITQQHTEEDKLIIGSYAHPVLVPHIASWVSAPFARMVSKMVTDFIVGEYKKCLNEKQARLEEEQTRRMNAEEWARQEKAGREVANQLLQLTEQQCDIMKVELASADEQIKEKDCLLENNDIEMVLKNTQLASAEMSLHSANHQNTKNHVKMTMLSCTHSFVILKVNDENAPGDYYVIRRKRKNVPTTIRKFQIRHPNASIMYHQKFAPNGVNLFLRLKAQRIVITHQNYFNIATCEHELVKCISAMCCDNIRPPIVNFST